MLSSKPFPPPVEKRPALPAKPAGAAVPFAQPPAVKRTVAGPPADPDLDSPLRKFALYFGLAALFVRFSVLPEVIAYVTGVNTYLLYITVVPAVVAGLLSGALRRTFSIRAAYWWMMFVAWLILAIPFSSWVGGSVGLLSVYSRTDLVFLLIAGGLAARWTEIRAVFYTIAAASMVNLLTARFFTDNSTGRVSLAASGSIGNSNDLAAHLLLVLPFLLFITMDPKRSPLVRIPALLGIVYGINVILGTASRGALFALIVGFCFILFRATPTQRIVAVGATVVMTVAFMAVLPTNALNRLGNLFGGEHEEAQQSGESRFYLFKTSVLYTFQHPVFGVGPGQFANFEGNQRVAAGKIGNWHETHCAFTEASSECGIPALIFFVVGLGSAILLVIRTHGKARQQGNLEIKNACFCYLLSTICFLVAITFLSQAYCFYLPVMIGLAGSLSFAANRQLAKGGEGRPLRPAVPAVRFA